MKKTLSFITMLLMSSLIVFAQRKTDALDRGVVAVKVNTGVYVSWRIQADEYYGVNYNLYRDGSLIAQNLYTSNYSDVSGSTSSSYAVAPVKNGVEGTRSAAVSTWTKQYMEIPVSNVQARSGVTVWKQNDPSSAMANYTINDIALGDVDGDGKIDFLVKRKNQTDQDNLFPTNNYQMYCQIECYASSINYGRLWWIDCGPNICYAADEQWDAVAFDWNEDGACEVLYRGGANTVIHHSDGTTETIGNVNENIRDGISHTANMTFTNAGEEWLMYIDGRTGKTYDVITYPLARGKASDWGDSYGHRSSKYFMGAPYFDGVNPYIFLGRGIYTKIDACAYRVNKSTNKLYKVGNTWHSYNNAGWYAQGYHNFAIADVDLDGSDEIVYGSMLLDFHTNDSSIHGMASTNLGHGDASHTGDLDPYRRGLETFACNEEKPSFNYRNAATCEIYARSTSTGDDGRAMAGNFTNEYPGGIGASTQSGIIPLSLVQPNPLSPTTISEMTNNWNTNTPNPIALNFRIYWDGDLLSETINGPGASENYLFVDKLGSRIFDTGHGNYETASINGTKKNPCATGDILGDWREEIVVRSADNRFIRVYTTVTPTEHRMPSLWYDHQYRQAMVWQTEGYNQPPHPSFFVGELEGLTQAPPPYTLSGRTVLGNGSEIRGSLHGGKDVFIMPAGNGSTYTVNIAPNAQPSTIYLNSRITIEGNDQVTYSESKHTWDRIILTGSNLSGSTNVSKQGEAAAVLPYATHSHSGKTDVWGGALVTGGSITKSPIWANIHTELFLGCSLAGTTSSYKSIEMEYGSALYIMNHGMSVPVPNDNGYGHMSVGDLNIKEGARISIDINGSNNANGDKLNITNLNIRKRTWKYGPKYSAPIFEFRANGTLAAGEYELGTLGNIIEGELDDIVIEIPNGKNGSISHLYTKKGKYYLHIGNSRYIVNENEPSIELADKTFYIYNTLQDKFLSRNGNEAYVDNFGIPFTFKSNGSAYALMQVDNGKYYNGKYWTNATGEQSSATYYTVNTVANIADTYTFYNTTNPADDGNLYINTANGNRVANNACNSNCPDIRNSYWKILTTAERDAIIENRKQKAAIQAASQAGIPVSSYSLMSKIPVVEDCTSKIANRTFGLSASYNVYEVYQGTANLTQTASGLKKGLYRLTLPALYRQGAYWDLNNNPDLHMSVAYIQFGNNQVQIKDWASDRDNTSNPNSRNEANNKFNAGKYSNVIYAYVPNDNGSINITIGCPVSFSYTWLAFGAIKLERVSLNTVKTTTFDFKNWSGDLCNIINDGTYVGTAWELGNARYQKIYSCTAPSIMAGTFAFQGVTNVYNGKGTILRQNYGMGMVNATRSAAICNLNKGAVVYFYISNKSKYPIDFRGGGAGDGTWNVAEIDGGYRVTMTSGGNLGFCQTKGGYNYADSYITKIVVENPTTYTIVAE